MARNVQPGKCGIAEPVIPKDPAYETRVRESFNRQNHMATLAATIVFIAPGVR